MTRNAMLSVWQPNLPDVTGDVLSIALVVLALSAVAILAAHVASRLRREQPRPSIVAGRRGRKRIPTGSTTETWSKPMSPENTPFPHTMDCKTPDAKPEWIDRGQNTFERICTCHKEVRYPPLWRRPDILDPKVMQHTPACEIADKPELLKHAVTIKTEATYDFATCGVCSRNWYAFDRPPE